MRLDLIDELHVSLFPYVAGDGARLFDGVPESYRLDLVSNTASSSGIVELRYRRHRSPVRGRKSAPTASVHCPQPIRSASSTMIPSGPRT